MDPGHIGVVIERLCPKSLSCPFHYHVHEDEFCLNLGQGMLRQVTISRWKWEGDAIFRANGLPISFTITDETRHSDGGRESAA